ncbi:MAG: tRNA (adenosine(37)-N6)-threonylcarbamoyltransferase complex dimerization subunit type 1 TsaB [Candidatus Omnitrophica bacterium]|jgi:tRNA threonylcarbamoyladenosine biosynthesis protein TsaB|nr:tRNA (adenosine(37)-N6)-threonylcarbamoyltransferase complex dimerization subunit type 1 TsaB [Candidatus Omnitrophota bacterium]
MNILAIDSSSENLSISLLWRGKILFDFNRHLKFGASQLVYFIDKNLRKHHISLKDIDIFAIGQGPGSFTGLRVSFSVIKAFMISLNVPAVCVGSFYSMVYPFSKGHKKIAVVSDARRGLVYAATFIVRNNLLQRETKEHLAALRDFVRGKSEYFFITCDEHLYKELSGINQEINFSQTVVYPKAKYYLKIAQDLAKKKRFVAIGDLEPLYLHPKTCQIRKKYV